MCMEIRRKSSRGVIIGGVEGKTCAEKIYPVSERVLITKGNEKIIQNL